MTIVKKRIFLITLPILLSLCLVSPALYALTWHLQHGNRIGFGGTELRVPRGWVATPREGRSLTFIKFPVLVFGLRHSTSGFTLGPDPANASRDPEELFKSWVSFNWSMWNGSDGVVKGPFSFGTGQKEIVCMTSFPNTTSGRGMASCLLFQRTWLAQFTGDKKDVESFFDVVRGASAVEEHSTGKR
jgi:hypothetical protein